MKCAELEFFLAVSKAESFCGAANELQTVQSNVTGRIKKLEADLGVALFQRHARGVTLTSAGRQFLPLAVEIDRLMGEARRCVADNGEPSGTLLLGAMETTAALRLGDVLADFTSRYPQVDLSLRTGPTAELIEEVLQQRIEGAFVCGPVAHPRLTCRTAFVEELAVVAPRSVGSLSDVARTGEAKIFVLRRGCSYRQRLESLLMERGVCVVRTMEYGTVDAILASVSGGLGITLLPVGLLPHYEHRYDFTVLKLPPAEARAETLFVRMKQSHMSSGLRAFLDTMDRRAVPLAVAAE